MQPRSDGRRAVIWASAGGYTCGGILTSFRDLESSPSLSGMNKKERDGWLSSPWRPTYLSAAPVVIQERDKRNESRLGFVCTTHTSAPVRSFPLFRPYLSFQSIFFYSFLPFHLQSYRALRH